MQFKWSCKDYKVDLTLNKIPVGYIKRILICFKLKRENYSRHQVYPLFLFIIL